MSEDFAALTAEHAAHGPDLGRLHDVLMRTREALPLVDNVGRSADARNAYVLIDQVVAALRTTYPASACGPGCGDCCRLSRALVRIYRLEWEVVHDFLLTGLDAATRRALIARFHAEHAPYLPVLHELQAQLDRGEAPRPTHASLPLRCPLLLGEACGVYPVRPAICRAYGHFQLHDAHGRDTAIFACHRQRELLAGQLAACGARVTLPSFNPLYQAIAELAAGEEKLLIPLWFWRTFPEAP